MDPKLKRILRAVSLEIRRLLEGRYDEEGNWVAGDLERRLNELGVRRDRAAAPMDELPYLKPEDKVARRLVDGYLKLREEAGVPSRDAVAEFVRESAYTWANRLFALRCMEARGLVDEVVLQKDTYGGRSLVHSRFARKNPEACAGEDDGLFTVLFTEFEQRGQELPASFDAKSSAVALRPSVAALKRTIALLSGRETAPGQDAATDEVFAAPDAFGWAYQYWNADEKKRVFRTLRTQKKAKIQGPDIIPATQLYTEPYMVKFLVQNSLGALWMGMYLDSELSKQWEFFVKDAARVPIARKPVCEITFLDPAQGSGHFHLEAFDLFYAMYEEEARREDREMSPREICAAILNQNLYGIDIDGRSVQIATAALWMKAKEKAPDLEAVDLTSFHEHLVATNIRLPKERNHLELFLKKYPDDEPLRPALELVFRGLEHADELGALLQVEELVDAVLRRLKKEADEKKGAAIQTGLFEKTLLQGTLPVSVEDYEQWKQRILERLQEHFDAEANSADAVQSFFAESAGRSFSLLEIFGRRYSVVAANPPYLSFRNVGEHIAEFLRSTYEEAPTDTYAAFMARALDVVVPGGRVAFVTQDGLLLLPSISGLRERILSTMQINSIVHLGPRAFEDISGEKVSVVLSIQTKVTPSAVPTWIRLVRHNEKAKALLEAAQNGYHRIVNGLEQSEYLRTAKKQFLYFAPRNFIDVLAAGHTFASHAIVKQGIISWDNARYIRYWWETPSINAGRWVPYFFSSEDIKLGASGLPLNAIDWRNGATWRFIRPRADELRFRHGIAFGRLGKEFRVVPLPPTALFDVNASAGLFYSRQFESWLFGYLCSPLIAAVCKALNVSLTFLIQDIANIPVPPSIPSETKAALSNEAEQLIKLRSARASLNLFAPNFISSSEGGDSQIDKESVSRSEDQCLAAIDEIVQNLLGLGEVEAETLRDLAEIAAIEAEAEDTEKSDDQSEPQDSVKSVSMEDAIGFRVLRLLGHHWPKQTEVAEPLPARGEEDGVVSLTNGGGETPLFERVRQRLAGDFPGGNVTPLQEFAKVVGEPLGEWLGGPFFERHISQFKKRPVAWQLESEPRTLHSGGKRRKSVSLAPIFSCLLYYQKLDTGLLPTIRTKYAGTLRSGFETELRTLERKTDRTSEQESRRLELEAWIEELKGFEVKLEQVSAGGFGPDILRPTLRQYAIDDALLSLTAYWLKKLNALVKSGPLKDWMHAADKTNLHPEIAKWVGTAFQRLDYFCATVGPKSPEEKSFVTDPSSKDLAPLVCAMPEKTVSRALELGCDRWWHTLDTAVLDPLKEQLKESREEQERIKEELKLDEVRKDYERARKLADRQDELKREIKALREEIDERTGTAGRLRRGIESWTCPEAATWEKWLSAQPMFDAVASLDGKRQPPATIAEFMVQESLYAPDINDGVRVNIAPLQKAGLLHASVLDAKDADRAIADRAEWRADERRWVREGKLPQPGWWTLTHDHEAGGP